MRAPAPPVDFLIIAPLHEERTALRAHLSSIKKLPPDDEDIRIYYDARLPFQFSDETKGEYRLIITSPLDTGRVDAATVTSDAIKRFKPRFVLLVGIAGGMGGRVVLGDIIIADQFIDYELQRVTDAGAEIRYQAYRADPRLLGAAQQLEGWQSVIKEPRPEAGSPRRHFGPVASGDKVQAATGSMAQMLSDWPKLMGVEMEAAGVARTAFQAPSQPGVLMIRSVSDLADSAKGSPTVESWRGYACATAAAFAIALLKDGPVPLQAPAATSQAADELQDRIPELEPAQIREFLQKVLATDSDFNAFCLDYFRPIFDRFGGGMDRPAKTNILLSLEDGAEVLRHLRRSQPERYARFSHLLKQEIRK